MTTQHTPGPWTCHIGDPLPSGKGRYYPHVHIGTINDRDFDYLAINSGGESVSQCEANARLIAAAPDLLEACQRQLQEHNALDEIGLCSCRGCDLARAALAKAQMVENES